MTLKIHAFLFSMVIQDIVVMESGTKPVITPTYRQKGRAKKTCDIILSTEVLTCFLILQIQVKIKAF